MTSSHPEPNITQAKFGSGALLQNLFQYNPSGKFIFISDRYQLPPIGEGFSPALSEQFLTGTFKIETTSADLTNIVRQSADNDLIAAASTIRNMYDNQPSYKWVRFPLKQYAHVMLHSSLSEMLQSYINVSSR